MSGFAAIGGVTQTLRNLLADRLDSPPNLIPPLADPAPVSVGIPPGGEGDDTTTPRINLFLYRVTQNGYLANQEIPGHGANGTAYGHPPLALDLHYLLTAYGTSESGTVPPLADEKWAHYLLGSAMRVLHDHAIIGEDLEDSLGNQILDTALQGAYERVKLTLDPLTLEDVAKVWTALNRPYRLSAAYEVRVVQIESTRAVGHPRPVAPPPPAGPRVVAVAAGSPRIAEVHAAGTPGPYARAGDTLVLTGTDLGGDPSLAWIDGIETSGAVTSARFDRATLVVPDDPRLLPGTRSVRLARGVMLGEPPVPHTGMKSNTAAFVLVPRIDSASTLAGNRLRLRGNRLLAPDVECETLVGSASVPRADYEAGSSDTILTLPLPAGAQTGELIRVRVNGAESFDEVTVP
jgi:hypothetical protein